MAVKSKLITFTVQIPIALKKKIKTLAAKKGISLKTLVVSSLSKVK